MRKEKRWIDLEPEEIISITWSNELTPVQEFMFALLLVYKTNKKIRDYAAVIAISIVAAKIIKILEKRLKK
jgi:hypothetical protein